MLLPGTIFASVLSMFSAYYATNPGYVDLDSSVCTPYGKSVLESDDCKTVLDCKTWSQPKILNCMRGVDRTLKDYECVYQYRSNRCNTTYEERQTKCSNTKATRLSDSTFCHLYYDCNDTSESRICPYPQLFNETTSSCQDYKNVHCGTRLELKSYCQYNPLDCRPSCIPCELSHPNCEGYSDGVHPHPEKTGAGSPWYMVCREERFVREGVCGNKYGYDQRLCEVMECDETVDKRYPASMCDEYIWCNYGTQYQQMCPPGTVFDDKTRSCNHGYDTCQPCGSKIC